MVTLKYLSNFWGTPKLVLINCEINLDLNWCKKCVKVATDVNNQGATFSIHDTKLYVPALTLLTQDNGKLLEQLKFDFKKHLTGININQKYQQKYQFNI